MNALSGCQKHQKEKGCAMKKLNEKQKRWELEEAASDLEAIEEAFSQLSQLEQTVLLLLASGFSTEDIAYVLDTDSETCADAIRRGKVRFLRAYRARVS